MILELDRVTRRFGSVTAVDHLSLAVGEGEFVTLLGPSGCGKTTALRLIAGFETPDEGRIRFRGDDVTRRSPQERGFGMVFQSYALFPHLNVFENVAFGLRSRGSPRELILERVRTSLSRVDLDGYEKRPVQALSGGQQQRVALARALAIEPPLLLLDEPLSNLDQALRVQTRTELRALVKALGITALFVTHDQEEAFDLSDRIAVMRKGRLHQIGTPRELYEEPANRFVAGFVGRANLLPVEIEGDGPAGSTSVRLPGGAVWTLPTTPGRGPTPAGSEARPAPTGHAGPGSGAVLLIRPEELRFLGDGDEVRDAALEGIVRDRRFQGAITLYRVESGGMELEVVHSADGPRSGERVRLAPRRTTRLRLFPDEPAAGEEAVP
jgi:ABC-type Fe3+/spermidine/putrescine transport system ATPase subunit